MTHAELADWIYQETGSRHDPAVISRKLKQLGVAPRKGTVVDLIPWVVQEREHRSSPLYYCLAALSRFRRELNEAAQKGLDPTVEQVTEKLSSTDRKWLRRMDGLILKPRCVVCYCPEHGFYMVPAEKTDTDIIRVNEWDTLNPRYERVMLEMSGRQQQPLGQPSGARP